MRTTPPLRLPADEHCAVHHFIRVHGRRPTSSELAEELRRGVRLGDRTSPPTPVRVAAWRRDLARLVSLL